MAVQTSRYNASSPSLHLFRPHRIAARRENRVGVVSVRPRLPSHGRLPRLGAAVLYYTRACGRPNVRHHAGFPVCGVSKSHPWCYPGAALVPHIPDDGAGLKGWYAEGLWADGEEWKGGREVINFVGDWRWGSCSETVW